MYEYLEMLSERPRVDCATEAACDSISLNVRAMSGGRWEVCPGPNMMVGFLGALKVTFEFPVLFGTFTLWSGGTLVDIGL